MYELLGRSFIYTKKNKSPSIELCGTTAKIADEVED